MSHAPRHLDVRAVLKALPPRTLAINAHKALERLNFRAQRFDAALEVLRREQLPTECRELVDRIVAELKRK